MDEVHNILAVVDDDGVEEGEEDDEVHILVQSEVHILVRTFYYYCFYFLYIINIFIILLFLNEEYY